MSLKSCMLASVLSVALSVALAPTIAAEDDAKELTFAQLPAPVQATLTKLAGGAALKEIEQENEDGKVVYTAEAEIGGKTIEFTVSPTGELLKQEAEDGKEDAGKKEGDDKEEHGAK
jgi:hypothetical protein